MRRWTYLLAFGVLSLPARSLADPMSETTQATVGQPMENAGRARGKPSFVAMPIPVVNPAIGNGLALGAIVLYTPSGSPRPWTTGGGGLYTDTGSWGVAAFQKAYLAEDRYRVTAGVGGGVFNVKFYGIGQAAGARGRAIELNEKGLGGMAEVLVRVSPEIHVGLRYRGARVDTGVKLPGLPAFPDLAPPQIELKSAISQLGLSAEYDSRDSEYNPNKGVYANAQWLFADEALGSDFKYDLLNAAVNGYHRLDETSLVAWRGSVCHAGDGAPFYDICNFGANNDLRGYPSGQFRDRAMFAAQVEYRHDLFWRFGAAAFVGVGEVATDFGKMGTQDLLPAAGVGLRFEASKKYKVNLSIDYAWGKDSSAAYFRIGEAF